MSGILYVRTQLHRCVHFVIESENLIPFVLFEHILNV